MRTLLLVSLFASGCDFFFPLRDPPRDPGDARDDASDAPIPPKYIFVTSALYTGEFGGLEGADVVCMQHVSLAQLTGTYMAWLSTTADSPATRMTQSAGPYHDRADTPIANSWADLTDGMLLNPIRTNEIGEPAPERFGCTNNDVWSNTEGDGTRGAPSCNDWTTDAANDGTVGRTDIKNDSSWTLLPSCVLPCSMGFPLYCVEQ